VADPQRTRQEIYATPGFSPWRAPVPHHSAALRRGNARERIPARIN